MIEQFELTKKQRAVLMIFLGGVAFGLYLVLVIRTVVNVWLDIKEIGQELEDAIEGKFLDGYEEGHDEGYGAGMRHGYHKGRADVERNEEVPEEATPKRRMSKRAAAALAQDIAELRERGLPE